MYLSIKKYIDITTQKSNCGHKKGVDKFIKNIFNNVLM